MKSDCLKRAVSRGSAPVSYFREKSLSAAPVRAVELSCKCNEPVNTVFVKAVVRSSDTPTCLPYPTVFYDNLLPNNRAEIAEE